MTLSASRSRRVELLLAGFVLVGVGGVAVARMGPDEPRSIPYRGQLERNGVAVTDTVTARFGLVDSADASTACVISNDCTLWSEEQEIDVVDGQFSVILGDGDGPTVLSDAVLARQALFLAVAVKAGDDTGFTALGGVQEIVPVPLAARAATVVDDGIGTAAIRDGSVTRHKLAPNVLFSATFTPEGNAYRPSTFAPDAWIESNLLPLTPTVVILARSHLPVRTYSCAAVGRTTPMVFVFRNMSPARIELESFDLAGVPTTGAFTLTCYGF